MYKMTMYLSFRILMYLPDANPAATRLLISLKLALLAASSSAATPKRSRISEISHTWMIATYLDAFELEQTIIREYLQTKSRGTAGQVWQPIYICLFQLQYVAAMRYFLSSVKTQ